MRSIRTIGVTIAVAVAVGVLTPDSARAIPLLDATFAPSLPFGPFTPDQSVIITAEARNVSPDQTITICEGICIGDEYTYSLGGLMSTPNPSGYYSYFFGNGGDTSQGWLNGQLAGTLAPGEVKQFIFAEFIPGPDVPPQWYSFGAQLQIFAATPERPMLSAPSFGGNFQVLAATVDVPEPSTLVLFGFGLLSLGALRGRKPRA